MSYELSTWVNPPTGLEKSVVSKSKKSGKDDTVHASADERIDEAIDESFPASDPPSWNAGADNGS